MSDGEGRLEYSDGDDDGDDDGDGDRHPYTYHTCVRVCREDKEKQEIC